MIDMSVIMLSVTIVIIDANEIFCVMNTVHPFTDASTHRRHEDMFTMILTERVLFHVLINRHRTVTVSPAKNNRTNAIVVTRKTITVV